MKNSTTSASTWKRRPSLSGESVTCLPLPRCLWSVDSQLWKLQRGLKVSSLVVSDAWPAASSFIHRWVRLEELQAIAAVARSRFGRRNAILGSAILDKLAMEVVVQQWYSNKNPRENNKTFCRWKLANLLQSLQLHPTHHGLTFISCKYAPYRNFGVLSS